MYVHGYDLILLYTLSETDCDIEYMFDWDTSSDEDMWQQLEEDIITWLEY